MINSKSLILSICFSLIGVICIIETASAQDEAIPKLYNPITVEYLENNLSKSSPKLILTPALESKLKSNTWLKSLNPSWKNRC